MEKDYKVQIDSLNIKEQIGTTGFKKTESEIDN